MHSRLLASLRELHSRATDGLHVRLLWDAGEDVTHHPFAYAAWRGIPTGAPATSAEVFV